MGQGLGSMPWTTGRHFHSLGYKGGAERLRAGHLVSCLAENGLGKSTPREHKRSGCCERPEEASVSRFLLGDWSLVSVPRVPGVLLKAENPRPGV